MKKLFSLAAMLFSTLSVFATDFNTVSTTPTDGETVIKVAEITLTYAEPVTVDSSKLPFINTVTENGEAEVYGTVAELSEDGCTVTITPLIFIGFPMPVTIEIEGDYIVHLQAGFVTSENGSSLAEDLHFTIGDPTALKAVEQSKDARVFDQQGRQVTEMKAGNFYIVNGKKVIR